MELAFDLIRCYILSLGKLEDVLLSIDDLEGTVGKEHANVTSVDPAFRVDGFASLLGLAEISLEVVVALVADLTTRHGDACLRVLILACIVHLRYVNKFNI